MKLQVGYGSQTFRLSEEGFMRWYHKDAKKIKQLITYRHLLGTYWTTSVDNREIYTIAEKDYITSTHWLVEHRILTQEGKLEFIPIRQVYLDKDSISNPGYWTIKLSKYKTIVSPKLYAEWMKKLKEKIKKEELEKKKK